MCHVKSEYPCSDAGWIDGVRPAKGSRLLGRPQGIEYESQWESGQGVTSLRDIQIDVAGAHARCNAISDQHKTN